MTWAFCKLTRSKTYLYENLSTCIFLYVEEIEAKVSISNVLNVLDTGRTAAKKAARGKSGEEHEDNEKFDNEK